MESAGRSFIECCKCRTTVVWPADISAALAAEFAIAARRDRLEGMCFAESKLRLGPREAKVLSLHVTRPAGHCHKCGKPVEKGESICACRSANIDW